MLIQFTVRGLPQTEGSKRGRIIPTKDRGLVAVVTDVNPRGLSDWRHAVKTACSYAYHGEPLSGPLGVRLAFYFLRPKSQTRAQRAGRWMPNGRDVDKLQRACFDAVSKVAWQDDRQVAWVQASKAYADVEHLPGVEVEIWSL